jgi:hypothetical protein
MHILNPGTFQINDTITFYHFVFPALSFARYATKHALQLSEGSPSIQGDHEGKLLYRPTS